MRNRPLGGFCFFGAPVLSTSRARPSLPHAAHVVGSLRLKDSQRGQGLHQTSPFMEEFQEGWTLEGGEIWGCGAPPLLPVITPGSRLLTSRVSQDGSRVLCGPGFKANPGE